SLILLYYQRLLEDGSLRTGCKRRNKQNNRGNQHKKFKKLPSQQHKNPKKPVTRYSLNSEL
ncbi:MAG: hypothetical protein J6Y21_07700, partial [Clostridia bacterium]|nr:hypothetical protein [Clostridia bacterium]